MGSCVSLISILQCCKTNKNKYDTRLTKKEVNLIKNAEFKTTPELLFDFTTAKVLHVYDGDTIWVGTVISGKVVRFSIRLYGIDCPEMRGGTYNTKAAAQVSKQYVTNRVNGKIVRIDVMNGRFVDGKKIKDPFNRLIAKVFIDDSSLSDELLKAGLAVPYYGGNKKKVNVALNKL
jgi:endonuclease YncB( thermonuclease family)